MAGGPNLRKLVFTNKEKWKFIKTCRLWKFVVLQYNQEGGIKKVIIMNLLKWYTNSVSHHGSKLVVSSLLKRAGHLPSSLKD